MRDPLSLVQRGMRLVLGATVVGAALTAQSAYASVVTVNFSSNPLSTVPFTIDGLYLNVVTGVASATTFAGYDINPYFTGSTTTTPGFRLFLPSTGGAVISAAGIAATLSAGTVVGPASTFASGVLNANQAVPGTNNFGFKFVNEATGITNYGYLTIQQLSNPVADGAVKVLSYSYENTGLGLTVAAAVPEPGAALLMLGGMAGLMLARRRQAA